MLDLVFSVANTTALLAWIALIALPRSPWMLDGIRVGVLGALSLLYGVLVSVWFFTAQGGGYGSLDAVAALFTSREILLAGWVHYLAFDLFVGVWVAQRCDRRGISRLVQAVLLAAIFMFGPFGYLLYLATTLHPRLIAQGQDA